MSGRIEDVTQFLVEAHRRISKMKHPQTEDERRAFWQELGGIEAQLELAVYRLTGKWPEDCIMPAKMREALEDTMIPMPPESAVKAVAR